ncbi:hypothetical protein M409DRAFT_49079 [Zasmidium cellare ATCC 36951]|uniref:Uncharacterized protein n=1 Tax=Zasmidium cellare ATCC 36951 TaxID=1080233 RepID=A0A6A6D7D3_ZASCE|nr:uncharacterized protein M409DRAFT_49079 [Zasmidium cellare ATCC 36951]KAF2174220.1 hypothetical protein M409DRAFT_49079 [Zasmidium cellare ATCC 36951]
MSRSGSRHGSHSHGHPSSHSRSSLHRGEDRHGGPPISMFNNPDPFGVGSWSRRPSLNAEFPPPRFSGCHPIQTDERQPSLSRSSSSRRASDRPMFGNPFGSGSHSYYDDSHHRSSRSGSRTYSYEDSSMLRPLSRRGGTDLSSAAHDFYDPFAGQLGTGRDRESIQGDPELPRYRSASAYHRSISRVPGNDVPGMPMRASRDLPPPYSSFASQPGGGLPMQFPPTRRPSHYDRLGGGLPPPDYFKR